VLRPRLVWTTTDDGDLAVTGDPTVLAARRARIVDRPWTWLHQVHGATVVPVDRPGAEAGAEADAAVTAAEGAVLAVHTADCLPIALLADGAVGVVHAGWRGLAAGVIGAAVDAVRAASPEPVRAFIGPCIRARCYEFGVDGLEPIVAALGAEVRATTAWGTPALDLVAGARRALADAGVTEVADGGICTACSPVHFSHRARGDHGRQALVAWLEAS
jgi:polyphenol oxidase